MVFSDLAVGVNPRKHPGNSVLNGLHTGASSIGLTYASVLAIEAARDFLGQMYPTLLRLPPHATDLFPLPATSAAEICAVIAAGLVAGGWTSFLTWQRTPRTEPFQQTDSADPKIHRDEVAEHRLKELFRHEQGSGAEKGMAIAPHVSIPRVLERRNIMVVGASGSGKSNIVRALAEQVIERGDFVVLHCTKGDVTSAFSLRDVVLISPTHRRGWAWDIGTDIDGPAAAAEFSASVIPSSNPTFFSDTGRLVMTDLILMIVQKHKTDWGARELLAAILQSPDEIRQQIAQLDLSASPLLAEGDADGVSRTVESILATITSGALKTLRPMAYAWSRQPAYRRFSVQRALSSAWTGPRVLIVQSNSAFDELSTSVCGGVLRRVCQCVASPVGGNDRKPVTMMLDEFYSLGRIEGIERSLSVAREHGIATVIALQSIWQLRQIYGDAAELLSDMFQIRIYGRQVPGDAVERVARDLGSRKISSTKKNRLAEASDTRKLVSHETDRPILSTTELCRDLGNFNPGTPHEVIRAVLYFAGTSFLLDWPPTRWGRRNEGYEPAAWTTKVPMAPKQEG
ncbi:type IV secretion system DNA-binding domain-containing protein [Fulvimarina sp. 2208YS6-2-32]|uniref:Type IV secretion system DNA-binding domain-containing protein n=1 Tax=Fulvimarina uroteuthidis TaxID=3098149 RepID=A0ABU5I6U2_9HYPH|nr:type IV secretion system DNA-binding domain-containing protein [Fulvimarina sp. 2208YS6-2-32]MDY8111082.1 type IV secretion system DNA-binding domain-containing protein [Fulvimarina sp. 2208YS6-2-32]